MAVFKVYENVVVKLQLNSIAYQYTANIVVKMQLQLYCITDQYIMEI